MAQSQSKLLGHFAVFLPSQCWCARFGFNCDKQHWEDEEMGQKLKKKQGWVEVSQLLLSETVANCTCGRFQK